MLIVETYKIKSGTWGYLSNQGKTRFLTGYCRDKNGFTDRVRTHVDDDGYGVFKDIKWIAHPGLNIVLSGSVSIGEVTRGRSAAGCMVTGPDQEFYMSVGNVVKTLEFAAEGKMNTGEGLITGNWTFAKQGDTISLTPYWKT